MIRYRGGLTRGTEHNLRVRGRGTWGDQTRRLYKHQRARYRQEMGSRSWAGKNRHLVQSLHQRERRQRTREHRLSLRKVAAGVLILGALLLLAPGTRGTGLMLLVLAALVLYVIVKRKQT
jgi:hypothetical protein